MATTSLSLGEHWEVFIKNEITSGRYGSASEVVRDALRHMEERNSKIEALRRHLAEGEIQAVSRDFVKDFLPLPRGSRRHHPCDARPESSGICKMRRQARDTICMHFHPQPGTQGSAVIVYSSLVRKGKRRVCGEKHPPSGTIEDFDFFPCFSLRTFYSYFIFSGSFSMRYPYSGTS